MSVSPLEHTAIGALGGTIEVCLMQPLVGVKNALQEGRRVPTNPVHLYRGLTMNILSMAPITASQFGTNRLVQQLILGKPDGELSSIQKFGCAAVAGAVSAFIASPSELIIIQQQKSGRTLSAEAKHFFATYPAVSITRGLLPAIGREALYAAGYLGLFPVLKEILDKQLPKDTPAGLSLIAAGVTGGVFAAACSHPFDTAKTRMQAHMYSKPEYRTLSTTFKTIYEEGGILQFWKGLTPRMTRIIAATFILNHVRNNSVQYLEDQRRPKPLTPLEASPA